MNAPLRFAAKACLVTAASGAMCIQVAGLFAQDRDSPSVRPVGTKIQQVQSVSPDAAGQGAQQSPDQETPLQKEIRKKFNKNGKEAPSFRLEDAPNTQPQVSPPVNPQGAGAQAGVAGKPAAAAAPAAPAPKPNWFERTFHIGKGRKQQAAAPANQYTAPIPPPSAPYRYPSQAPAARPTPPVAYRAPIAAVPQVSPNPAPYVKPAPVVAGPAATAAPAQPQFREPAPLGPTTTPAPRALAERALPPTVRPARPRKDSQPLLDESKMNDDSESLELDDEVDEDPKKVGQAPQALPSDLADGPAESPYTGLKIAPNETEEKFAASRPKTGNADETAADEAKPEKSAKDTGDVAAKTADAADKPNPEAAVAAKKPAKPATDDFDLDDDDDDDDELSLTAKEPAKNAEAGKDEKESEKLVEPAPFSGLKGICPVALKDNRKLIDAQPGIRSEFAGKTYTFSSIEAKKTFDENPRKYAPVVGGNDVVKQTAGEAGVAGSLEHAAWYRGRLYLFSTADSRHEFVETPSKFVVED